MATSTSPAATSRSPPPAPEPAPAPNVQADPVIEADDAQDDAESSLGEDIASSTTSITSSILRYREENGRSYHAYKDGIYLMPNDEREQDRLDLQHHLFLITFNDKLHLCPAGQNGHKIHNVLDVGTGTGLWACDFGDEHPEAQVIGTDLSPIQNNFVPPNVSFQIDDLEEPWTFHVKFDFIYSRMMTASFADWPRFFKQAYDSLAPGGWFEVVDICPITSDDGTLTDELAVTKWVKQLLEGTKMVGRAFDEPYLYKQQIEAVGFVNITRAVYRWPQNRWPKDPKLKDMGSWVLANISQGLEALSAAVYTRVLGWSKEELDVFLVEVRNDLRNTTIHAYWPIMVVYAQKPE